MNISYNWLKTYTQISHPAAKIAEFLTNSGLEVETIKDFESIKGALEGLVVGKVLECKKHPNADSLSLTEVDIGPSGILPIVCGAPNVAKGQMVVVAPVGTTLHAATEPFTIKKAKIRGEISEGMICAHDEIGTGSDHSGIVVLNEDLLPGMSVAELFEVEQDTVFEIGLTPNRIDGASHIGTARDLVAALSLDEVVSLSVPTVDHFKTDSKSMDIQIQVVDQQACIRYSGVCLSGVQIAESPAWLKNKLKSIGLNPINNVVDITNFVLHETGQPLHAFDADKIQGEQIVVKTLPKGSTFITLDEEEQKLEDTDLMICDAQEGMCIAGVFGGIKSGVSSSTTNIFLESACFNPVSVRKTSKRLGLSTDSSFRFERGTDPNGTIYALKRAALLIKEIAGAEISSSIVDIYPKPIKPYEVSLRWTNLDRLVGIMIPHETVRHILKSLDIHIVSENKLGLELEVATYRVDVRREADVIEEILRIYGYNNVGINDQVRSTLNIAPNPDPEKLENLISDQLSNQGFYEMMANSLTKASYYSKNPEFPDDRTVKLLNPLSSDLGVMRQTLLYGVLEAVSLNSKHRNQDLRMFEFGNVYHLLEGQNCYLVDSYCEERHIALVMAGQYSTEQWLLPENNSDFYTLKGHVGSIFQRLGININECEVSTASDKLFYEGITLKLNGKEIASIGQIASKVLEQFEIEIPVFYADINWKTVLNEINLSVRFKDPSKFPTVRRDLALVLDQSVNFEDLRLLAFQVERKLLKSMNLFDVFESDKLGVGKKSYAISFILQDDSRTLTDKQIERVMKNLLSAFEQKIGAVLR